MAHEGATNLLEYDRELQGVCGHPLNSSINLQAEATA